MIVIFWDNDMEGNFKCYIPILFLTSTILSCIPVQKWYFQYFCLNREVVTFNHFLEEAAEKEFRGKARLQHFIENLLQRVDLAERQLEYYQNQQITCNYSNVNEHVVS